MDKTDKTKIQNVEFVNFNEFPEFPNNYQLTSIPNRGGNSPDIFRPRGMGNCGDEKFSPGNPRGGQFT